MRRGFALLVAAAALATSLAVGTGDAAVPSTVSRVVESRANDRSLAAAPARSNGRGRARSAMAILEQAVVDRMNLIRRNHGLRPLRISSSLAAAADYHSADMARRGYFEHDSANGTAFWRRIERFYPSRGFRSWTVGENLLWATDTYGAAFAVREWMGSPPHRENILSRQWREVGIGAIFVPSAPGAYRGRAVTIMTADFGARR